MGESGFDEDGNELKNKSTSTRRDVCKQLRYVPASFSAISDRLLVSSDQFWAIPDLLGGNFGEALAEKIVF